MRAEGVEGVSTKSTATDVVTAADRAVERETIAALRACRPHDAFLGEESGGWPATAGCAGSSTPSTGR
jgi:myo-inositol-1(or 4)-monophosphatase